MPQESIIGTNSGDLPSLLEAAATHWEQLDSRDKRQAAVLAFGRRANARPDLAVLMQDAAALCAEIVRADLSGIGEYDQQRRKLSLRVGVTDIKGASRWLHYQDVGLRPAADQLQESMAAYAITVGSPVVSPDLQSESRFKDRFLCSLGIHSAVSVPLYLHTRPLGTLGVYSTSQRSFDEHDAQFLETIAHLLSSSIARVNAEEALARQMSRLDEILEQIDTLVFGLDDKGKIISVNRAAERSSGFSAKELCGRLVTSALALPLADEQLESYLRRAVVQAETIRFDSVLVTKDGTQRQIAWVLKSVGQQSNSLDPTVVLTGADRTAELQAQAEAAAARAAAQQSAEELRRLRQMLARSEDAQLQEATDTLRAPPGGQAVPAQQWPAGLDAVPGAESAERTAAAQLEASVVRALAEGLGTDQSADQQPFRPQQSGAPHEKRSSPRRQFKYHQLIAPIYGEQLPSPKKFFAVACEDISAGGIAFYLDWVPDFHKLVVALGKPPTLAYFSAEVVRYSKKHFGEKTMYLVGCRFNQRIPSSAIER